ncbi:hypothetical protein [Streptomyces sp. NPDC059009]|uniref:DUF7919 family protein n=1 Tax=Streptomyces sp. NPDC059009 TaxID=3346694 RepID=UPI00369E751E
MTAYDDMSTYQYAPDTVPSGTVALNVGWLERDTAFQVGETPAGFLESLLRVTRDYPAAKMRGWHRCSLPHENDEAAYPYRVRLADVHIALGGAEVRVYTPEGKLLSAPDLVYHYVKDHNYLPPEEFIEAVLSERVQSR